MTADSDVVTVRLSRREAEALAEAGADARKHLWTRRDMDGLNGALRALRRATAETRADAIAVALA